MAQNCAWDQNRTGLDCMRSGRRTGCYSGPAARAMPSSVEHIRGLAELAMTVC